VPWIWGTVLSSALTNLQNFKHKRAKKEGKGEAKKRERGAKKERNEKTNVKSKKT
jgi:hypothetical protein